MSRITRIILGVVVALGAGTAVLAFLASQLGPTVDAFSTATALDGTMVNSQIAITFSTPMRNASVEHNFRILPRVKGDFNWTGNELIFSPRKNFAYGRGYTVIIGTGAVDTSGKKLRQLFRRQFVTQGQHLLYLGTQGSERNRLVLMSTTGVREIIGPDDGSVHDYSVSPDQSTAVFTRRGGAGERSDEIWLASLSDNSSRRLFRKPDWSIAEPQLSPDGRTIVFLATNVRLCRKYYSCYRDTTVPLIYFLDVQTGKASPYSAASDTPISNFVAWSPDSRIAYTDLGSALVLADIRSSRITHLPNKGDSLLFSGFDPGGDKVAFVGQTLTSTGGDVVVYTHGSYVDVSHGIYDAAQPAFSSTGTSVVYSAYRSEYGKIPNLQPVYGLNVYNFKTRRTTHVTSGRSWTDWGATWSLNSGSIAFVRTRPEGTLYLGAGQIWIVGADGRGARPLGAVGRDLTWVG